MSEMNPGVKVGPIQPARPSKNLLTRIVPVSVPHAWVSATLMTLECVTDAYKVIMRCKMV